jgi:hypothetical protein
MRIGEVKFVHGSSPVSGLINVAKGVDYKTTP